MIVIESGLPDPATFPVDELAACFAAALEARPQYGGMVDGELLHGPVGLRSLLATDPSTVLLTAGAAHAISLVVRAFVGPGDVVAVECPSWDYILRDLELAGASVLSIPLDDDGLDVDALERELRAGARPKLVYVIADFNVPTGAVLSLPRRERLVALAAEFGFLVLEDGVYRDVRFEGDPLPTLASLDPSVVVRVDTFSKTISPGLRLGWAEGPAEVIAALAAVRRDLGTSHLTALAVERYLRGGTFPDHLARIRELYRQKRDVAVAALGREGIACRPPAGGFFLWLALPESSDGAAVHARAAAEGVVCRPGPRFFADPADGAGHLRLSFTEPSCDDLERAAAILGRAL